MVVSRALRRHGVRTAFALAGAGHAYVLDALDRDGVRIVGGRHESGTVGAADGYARITRGLGVALTITDQGLPNALNGIACAWHAASPVVVLMARLPHAWTEAEAEYDNLSLALVRPITKWCGTVPSASRLGEFVDVACKRAVAGRPGPVVLQLPMEFLGPGLPAGAALMLPPAEIPRLAPEPAAVARAADVLATAQRPLIVCGAGATRANAGAGVRRLCLEHGIPVAGNSQGRGLVPEDDAQSFAWPYMQIAAKHADAVLVLGARLKQRLGHGLPPRFAADAKFVQVDVEAEELSRNRRIDVPLVADAALAADAIAAALAARRWRAPDPRWLHAALAERRAYLTELAARDTDPIHPLRLGRAVQQRLPEDAIVVCDGADIATWMYGALRIRTAPGFLDHYPLGAMGVGTPLAVGAAAAARDLADATGRERPVVLVTGDGSIGFHPAELHAAALARLPLVVVIGNDAAWGVELHTQRKALGRDVNTDLGLLPYEHLGPAFGGRGHRVGNVAELDTALDRAFDEARRERLPVVVNVPIDQAAGAAIKSDPRAAMILFDDLATGLGAMQGFGGA
jgi:acetolactate synthase-1/2/3 large subunit